MTAAAHTQVWGLLNWEGEKKGGREEKKGKKEKFKGGYRREREKGEKKGGKKREIGDSMC